MRKIALLLFLIMIIVLGAVLLGNRANQDMRLSKEIDSELAQGVKQIDLSTMPKFEWKTVGVFGPYTTNEQIEDAMNIQFSGDNGGIDVLDDRFLLVFSDGKNAIETVVLSREYGDFFIEGNKVLIVEK